MIIPYGKQSIDDDDIAVVVRALRSDYLTTGPEVEAFEREFAEFVGAKHAVVVCNATAALHLAMLVADIGAGDRVITSPNTFLSSANCAAFVGAIPDFSDIDPGTYNLCPKALEVGWQDDTKAVVAVAYAGLSCDMPAIAKVARQRGAIVIEDGCHGIGGGFVYEGRFYRIGGHPWADMTVFSFHPVKTMTTGEGGVLVTDNDEYAERARMLRTHGIVRDVKQFSVFNNQAPATDNQLPITESGPWTYEMQALGYNYRITDIQCALGRSQLKKLPGFIRRRQEIVDRYNQAFSDLSWLITPVNHDREMFRLSREDSAIEERSPNTEPRKPNADHRISCVSWHLYTVLINFQSIGKSRVEVMTELRDQGVGTQVLYIPVYLQPWYQKQYGYALGKCSNAEAFYERTLSLPLYPNMSEEEIAQVIHAVTNLEVH